jgi:signal-transduction protein with cAMP-binding, CBS, and nucleotidyltransferase domain
LKKWLSVQKAAKKMKEKDVISLVVLDNQNKPQAIVTERDLVRKACINDIRTSEVTLAEIMSSSIITIDSNFCIIWNILICSILRLYIPNNGDFIAKASF